MEFWVSATAGAIVVGLVKIFEVVWNSVSGAEKKKYKDCEKQLAENADILIRLKATALTLLHYHVKNLSREYISAGTVTFNDRKDLLEMYDIYHELLGGNGSVSLLIDEVKKLPCER